MGLYLGGGGGAYIWNEVSVSTGTCGGLIHGGGGLYSGGLIVGGLRYIKQFFRIVYSYINTRGNWEN